MRFSFLSSVILLLSAQTVIAGELGQPSQVNEDTVQTTTPEGAFKHLWLSGLGVYTDFKFNSTAGTNYNNLTAN